jgi:subtilisin family serine protease
MPWRAVLGLGLLVGCGPQELPEGADEAAPSPDVAQVTSFLRAARPVPGEYIVVLRDDPAALGASGGVEALSAELAAAHRGEVVHTYRAALRGFATRMPEAAARALSRDPRVAYVEENGEVSASATQTGATWGLDRVDQRDLPLNQAYTYNATGAGVNAYIVDTGILTGHTDFGGRASPGYTAINDGRGSEDCNGHGTHVAGTVGGGRWGVAKGVRLYAVRVLGCNGSGTNAGVIAGIDWVAQNRVLPAVANMSLGGGASQAVDDAIARATAAGVTMVVAAGNENQNACNVSPARAPSAITVGSTTSSDARSSFSNFGTCVDIFAPGSSITSAWYTSTTATNTISGTSMASPHVAGAAALYLEANPSASPAAVTTALTSNSTPNKVTSAGTGSPNRLLYTGFIGGGGGGGDTTPPSTSITAPASGATVSGTVTVSASASDNVGVSRVEFYAGSTLLGTDSAAPYEAAWNTTAVANGTYALTSRAFDAAGNAATSATVSVTVSNSTGTCSTTSQLLANPGFESGNVSWTTTSGVIDSSTGAAARTGSWKAWLNGYGTTRTDSAYQTVAVPAGACSASLTFWLRITSAETTTTTAYDRLTVTVRDTAGTVLRTLATYSNLNKNAAYEQRTFDLREFAGRSVRIHFNGTEDGSLQTSFLVDDTALTVTR